jgi:hypothetical protein
MQTFRPSTPLYCVSKPPWVVLDVTHPLPLVFLSSQALYCACTFYNTQATLRRGKGATKRMCHSVSLNSFPWPSRPYRLCQHAH